MFPALRALNVSFNQFTGTIPSQLGQSGIFQSVSGPGTLQKQPPRPYKIVIISLGGLVHAKSLEIARDGSFGVSPCALISQLHGSIRLSLHHFQTRILGPKSYLDHWPHLSSTTGINLADDVLLCAVQTPLYLSTGQALQQVFDLSHNYFNGSLPSFLAEQAVPAWTQQGIFLQASLRFATPDTAVLKKP